MYTELGLHGLRALRFGATRSFAKTTAIIAWEQTTCVRGVTLRSLTADVPDSSFWCGQGLGRGDSESESDDRTRVQAHE